MEIEKGGTFDLYKRIVKVDAHDRVALEGESSQLVRRI